MNKISFDNVQKLKVQDSVHDYEFQELGVELEPIYGKLIWTIFYKPNVTEYKVRQAHRICQQKGKKSVWYLLAVVKNMG